jgi:hypothetical protein
VTPGDRAATLGTRGGRRGHSAPGRLRGHRAPRARRPRGARPAPTRLELHVPRSRARRERTNARRLQTPFRRGAPVGLRGGDARRPGGGRLRRGGGARVAVGPPDRPTGRTARAGFGATVRGIRPGPALPHDAERETRRVPKDRAVRPRREQRGPQVRSLPPGGGRKDLRRGPRRLLPRTAQAPNGDLGLRGRADPEDLRTDLEPSNGTWPTRSGDVSSDSLPPRSTRWLAA